MFELRKTPRINVTWRAHVKMDDNKLVPIRIINVSNSGFLFLSSKALMSEREYQLNVEVPSIDKTSSALYHVNCVVALTHSVLSGEQFRVGVKFVNISSMHRDLINAWVSLASKFDPE
jgi:c-di-GMP-binding flagellar brake protein YcgR